MRTIIGIPGVTGTIPEVPEPTERVVAITFNGGGSKMKSKKNKAQKRQEIYLRFSRSSLPAKQRQ